MIGEAMREIGILVAVFGMLDKFLLATVPPFGWTVAVLASAMAFFALGTTIERRRHS
jgi:hypothetical protein